MKLRNSATFSIGAVFVAVVVGYQFMAGAKPVEAGAISTAGWMTNLDAALSTASREHRQVFVDFYSDTCPPCRELDEKVFPTPDAKAALAKFVTVKVKLDDATEAIFQKYGVSVTPTLMVMNDRGEAVRTTVGFVSAKQLGSFLEAKS